MPAVDANVPKANAGPSSAVTWLSTPQLGPDRVRIEPTVPASVTASTVMGARRRHSSGNAIATPQNAHQVCPSWR